VALQRITDKGDVFHLFLDLRLQRQGMGLQYLADFLRSLNRPLGSLLQALDPSAGGSLDIAGAGRLYQKNAGTEATGRTLHSDARRLRDAGSGGGPPSWTA
jgi:hypothetical protein